MIIYGASKTALLRKRNPICAQAPWWGEFVKLYNCLPLVILQRGAKPLKITNFLIRRMQLKSCEEEL